MVFEVPIAAGIEGFEEFEMFEEFQMFEEFEMFEEFNALRSKASRFW